MPRTSPAAHLRADQVSPTVRAATASAVRSTSALDLPSPASQATLGEVRRLARHDWVPVCLVGASGTGKSLYAREIHERSPRRKSAYVRVNLAAIPKQLSAAELLGYVPGAFTGAVGRRTGRFASANGGTLVLDEITKAARTVQHLLLDLLDRVPQQTLGSDREIELDLRIVSLTSSSLESALRAGRLIPDLYERLKPFVVEIAPLRDRRPDVDVLTLALVREHSARFGYLAPPSVDPALVEMIAQRPLSGNHRELDGLVQRCLANAEGARTLTPRHLPAATEVVCVVSKKAKRLKYLEDCASPSHRVFASVADEARFRGVSPSTIYRWRSA